MNSTPADWIIDEPMRAIGSVPESSRGRVPLASFVAALEDAHQHGPAGFAWQMGCGFDMAQLGPLGRGIAGASRLGDALSLLAEGFPLIQTGAETLFETNADRTVFSYRLYDGRIWPRAGDAELTLGLAAGILSQFGISPSDGITIRVERGPDEQLAGLTETLRRPVASCASVNALILPACLLDRTRSAAPDRRIDVASLMAQQERRMPLPVRLRTATHRALATGDVSQDRIAATLGMSQRTMRRRLKDEGVGFRDTVDDCRHARAVSLLRSGHRSLAEIALDLGYSDQAAFTRAARRWFKETPGAARRHIEQSARSGRKGQDAC